MKINVRILLIIFAAVVLISVPSTLIYYNSTKKLIKNQYSKELVNSANDFIFAFQKSIQKLDENFINLSSELNSGNNNTFELNGLDFVIAVNPDSKIKHNLIFLKKDLGLKGNYETIDDFIEKNPNIVLKYKTLGNRTFFFGKVITSQYLNDLAERIRSDIALINNGVPVEFSNSRENKNYLLSIINAEKKLRGQDNFSIVNEELEPSDFLATHYIPKNLISEKQNLDFLIFTKSREMSQFRSTMSMFVVVIVVAGIFLSIILVLLFTAKFRKQISLLDDAVSKIGSGDLNHKVKIITKDEIGRLGETFNVMVDKLKQKEKTEKEYSEFLTLINQNPGLEEISEAVLKKITSTTGMNFGALYLYEEDRFELLYSYGFSNDQFSTPKNIELYKVAIKEKHKVEFHFDDNFPVIKTGLTEIQIRHIIIMPVLYNNEVIAILELASQEQPASNVNEYLQSIKDQLSIGLINSKALKQLNNLVEELKQLNEAYQKQNKKVTKQNIELKKLHSELKEKANELQIQTKKALESAKVKSQFLASMSHELKTPQNSIIGLTELVLRDKNVTEKTKERLTVVLRNSKKLLELINNILEFSKLESGNVELRNQRFTLKHLLEEVKTLIEPLLFDKPIAFNINFQKESDYWLYTDRSKLEQIFYNLIGNAIKFTKEGFIKINVDIVNSGTLILEVIDSGIGIDEKDRERIFDEFRQGDEGISRQYNGTGLGLAICKRYIEMLNGKIELDSAIGKGSKFIVTLPQIVEKQIEDYNLNAAETKVREVKNKSVLLLSNNDVTTKLIGDYLKAHDVFYETLNDYVNLSNILKEMKVDLLILDFNYSNYNIWNLLDKINSISHNSLPVTLTNIRQNVSEAFGVNLESVFFNPSSLSYVLNGFELNSGNNLQVNKILLAGDNRIVNLIDSASTDEKEFLYANDSKSVISQIKNGQPELVVIDILSKDLNPFLLAFRINKEYENLPVIFVSTRELTGELSNRLSNNFIEASKVYKLHPLDVLKIVRDELNLYTETERYKPVFPHEIKENISYKVKPQKSDSSTKRRILVVDDNNDALFTVGEIVQSLGYNVLFAKNGYECLDVLENQLPDLILLDIMMPKMDGFETIKKIRQELNLTELPVFALTAYAMLSDKEILHKNGFNDLITKPVDTEILKYKLKNFFHKADINEKKNINY